MWSNKLTELSKSEFIYGGCNVKNENGQFGFLISDIANSKFRITLLDSKEEVNFTSIFDLLEAGWAVD